MIKVSDITFSYGTKPIFHKVSFIVGKGQKVGIVGPNGAGKSTLLQILLKKELPQEGMVQLIGSIGYVPQEVKRDKDLEAAKTVRDYIDPTHEKPDHEISLMLGNLEAKDIELDSLPQKLSGGKKTKLALARALVAQPDILLLDEPTNFMDIAGKKWVMNFLSHYPKTLILISHDLELMDNAIDKVLSLNAHMASIEEFKGNYTKYIKLKAEKEAHFKRQVLEAQRHIKRMEEGLKKLQRYKSEKGVRVRVNLQNRIERAKEKLPELPPDVKKIKIKLPTPSPVGELLIKASNIWKSFGDVSILKDVSFTLYRSQRVALIGPNGAGKSTLIKILMGLIPLDQGDVYKDENLRIGYYSQEFETFDMTKTILETFMDSCQKEEHFSRVLLAKYMFPGDKVFQRVGTLSGGEKTRLSVALLTGNNFNLLVLDEPTTYLDVVSQKVILEALKTYEGAILLVSHTEEFVIGLKPEKVLVLPENKFTYWSPELVDKVSLI